MALHGKIWKNHKNRKNLKTTLFMFSPSRAGGSFLSHEGGEKASDGKAYSSRVTTRVESAEDTASSANYLLAKDWRVLRTHEDHYARRDDEKENKLTDMAVESEEPPESGVGGRVYCPVGCCLFRQHVY